MNNSFLELISRHKLIWDDERINILKKSKIVLIGLGGFGTHVADQLVRLGVSDLILIDFDTVKLSNLNRQCLFTASDIGKNKADCAKYKLLEIVDPMITGLEIRVLSYNININTPEGIQLLESLVKNDVHCWIDNIDDNDTKLQLKTFLKKHNQVLIQPNFLMHRLDIENDITNVLQYTFRQSILLQDSIDDFEIPEVVIPKLQSPQPMSVQMCAIAASAVTYSVLYKLWERYNSLKITSSRMEQTLQFDVIKNRANQ